MTFQLHQRLEQDCIELGKFQLSRLLLMNDSRFPWCLLVPEREHIREIYQLSGDDQRQLLFESSLLSATMADIYQADKMNIAAIGNMVPQLHIHHVARYRTDPAWPGTVWGHSKAVAYDQRRRDENVVLLRKALKNALID